MMLQAILSDIYGNLEALEAVMKDIASFNVDEVICLGDLVGYGPDPFACLEIAMNWDVLLRGSFTHAAIFGGDLIGLPIHRSRDFVLRFRDQLANHPRGEEWRQTLSALPTSYQTAQALYVHATPRNHHYEYLFPEDIYSFTKISRLAAKFSGLCFCGHSQLPGIFVNVPETREWTFSTPVECGMTARVHHHLRFCNVGSVGQPRDRDPRACYVLFDGEMITFRKVSYDIETTRQKIRECSP